MKLIKLELKPMANNQFYWTALRTAADA